MKFINFSHWSISENILFFFICWYGNQDKLQNSFKNILNREMIDLKLSVWWIDYLKTKNGMRTQYLFHFCRQWWKKLLVLKTVWTTLKLKATVWSASVQTTSKRNLNKIYTLICRAQRIVTQPSAVQPRGWVPLEHSRIMKN